ncbi:MAG: hypothetical protein ChlgKO_04370 [Chlamydiales bacterium]
MKKNLTIFALFTSCLTASWYGPCFSEIEPSLAEVIENAKPAIVEIMAISEENEESITYGIGTGFLISNDGYLLTADHVIEEAISIAIFFDQLNEAKEAKIIGRYPELDLALLKIPGYDYPYLTFAEKNSIRPGDQCIGTGFPFTHTFFPSVGHISVTHWNFPTNDYADYALVSTEFSRKGFSGGPLLNTKGEVLGLQQSCGIDEIGNFQQAYPGFLVERIAKALQFGNPIKDDFLKATLLKMPPTKKHSTYKNLETKWLLEIAKIETDSPLAKSLRAGDSIVCINGKSFSSLPRMFLALKKLKRHTHIELTILRENEPNLLNLSITPLKK